MPTRGLSKRSFHLGSTPARQKTTIVFDDRVLGAPPSACRERKQDGLALRAPPIEIGRVNPSQLPYHPPVPASALKTWANHFRRSNRSWSPRVGVIALAHALL